MKEAGYIPRDAWQPFVQRLTKRFHVYAPCKEGDTVTFERLTAGKEVCLDRPAHSSPKGVIFPQSETLFVFSMRKESERPQRTDVSLTVDATAAETLILGGRPCDARGFALLDPVLLGKDPYYRERRQKTTIISYTCPHSYSGCFCTSVGSGPADARDSDAIVTELEKGYYVEALTEKGSAALDQSNLEDGADYRAEAERRRAAAEKQVVIGFENGKDVQIDTEVFGSDAFWDESSARCISCGACTYVCPTCHCFNITDEQGIHAGERLRNWDSCMFAHYTVEASGHNPRGRKGQRLKNRIGHKFVYYPELYHEFLCSGCGRCIRHCPASISISRLVSRVARTSTVSENEAKR